MNKTTVDEAIKKILNSNIKIFSDSSTEKNECWGMPKYHTETEIEIDQEEIILENLSEMQEIDIEDKNISRIYDNEILHLQTIKCEENKLYLEWNIL